MAGITIYIYLPPKVEISLSSLTHTFLFTIYTQEVNKMLQKSHLWSQLHIVIDLGLNLFYLGIVKFLTGLPPSSISTYLLPCWHIYLKKNLTWSIHFTLLMNFLWLPTGSEIKSKLPFKGILNSAFIGSPATPPFCHLQLCHPWNFLFLFQHFMIFHTFVTLSAWNASPLLASWPGNFSNNYHSLCVTFFRAPNAYCKYCHINTYLIIL